MGSILLTRSGWQQCSTAGHIGGNLHLRQIVHRTVIEAEYLPELICASPRSQVHPSSVGSFHPKALASELFDQLSNLWFDSVSEASRARPYLGQPFNHAKLRLGDNLPHPTFIGEEHLQVYPACIVIGNQGSLTDNGFALSKLPRPAL